MSPCKKKKQEPFTLKNIRGEKTNVRGSEGGNG